MCAAHQFERWDGSFDVKLKSFPPELVNEIQTRLNQAKKLYPVAFSKDRNALLVDGSIGYDCYVTPEGDVFMETYDPGSDEPPVIDRSRRAQIQVLVLGSRNIPMLAEMLPKRPSEVPECAKCGGSGRLYQEFFRHTSGSGGILCDECSGLGWAGVL